MLSFSLDCVNTATDLCQITTYVRMTFIELLCRQTSPGDYKSIHDERALSEFSFMSEEKRGRRGEGLFKKQDKY